MNTLTRVDGRTTYAGKECVVTYVGGGFAFTCPACHMKVRARDEVVRIWYPHGVTSTSDTGTTLTYLHYVCWETDQEVLL